MNVKTDIFTSAKEDDSASVEDFLVSGENDVNEVNDSGLTGLHICATYGSVQTLLVYLQYGADINIKDKESGWSPLHRSIYFGHIRVSIILIQSGAVLDDQISMSNRMQTNMKVNPFDKDGLTPRDILLNMLAPTLCVSRSKILSSNLLCFGKSDFTLGVPLPKSSEVIQPKRVETLLNECIIQVCASKYHSVAASRDGNVYSWGHGRGGRLGHGDEASQPEPQRIAKFGPNTRIQINCVANGENHTLAVSTDGRVYSWGVDRYGQLGLGGSNHDGTRIVVEPRRIESLRREYVVLIAAGDVHSLCGTRDGLVFSWGSNKNGQLGLKHTEMSRLATGELGIVAPKRVHIDALSNSTRQSTSKFHNFSHTSNIFGDNNRKLFDLSASHDNSLLLCRGYAVGQSAPNEIYQWGHGIFTPARVVFSGRKSRTFSISHEDSNKHTGTCKRSGSSLSEYIAVGTGEAVHIFSICTGKHHYAALTRDGSVYTWGVNSERDFHPALPVVDTMGEVPHNEEVSRIRYFPSRPQLVEALLPERGGSRIVSLAATVNRTCAVTELGELYTWDASTHKVSEGVRPISREAVVSKVAGVYRAIAVSASSDHTLVLCATSLPVLPLSEHSMFQDSCPQTGRLLPPAVDSSMNKVHKEDIFAVDEAPLEDTIEGSLGGSDTELPDVEDVQLVDLDTTEENDSFSSDEENIFGRQADHIPSLQALCERELAKSVSVKTATNALMFADQFGAELLQTYSAAFIQMNLDAVLTQTKPSDMEGWAAAMGFSPQSASNLSRGEAPAVSNAGTPKSPSSHAQRIQKPKHSAGSGKPTLASTSEVKLKGKEKETKSFTSADITRQIKANKKKLAAIEELFVKIRDTGLMITPEQAEKMNKKGVFQQELANLEQLLVRCKVRERNEETKMLAVESTEPLSSNDLVHDQMDSKENSLPATEFTMQPADIDANMKRRVCQHSELNSNHRSITDEIINSGSKATKKMQTRRISLQEFNRIAAGTTSTTVGTLSKSVSEATAAKISNPWGVRSAVGVEEVTVDLAQQQHQQQQHSLSVVIASSARVSVAPSNTVAKSPSQLKTSATSGTPAKVTSKLSAHVPPSDCSAGELSSRRTHALLDFLPGAKATISPTPPVKSKIGWGTSPSSTAAVSTTTRNSTGKPQQSKPALSLSEIQRAEEAARQASAVSTLRGNTVPWLIERRPRADSIEAVVRQQLWEKQEEEEIQAAIAEIERVTKEQELVRRNKPGSDKKEKRKQHKKPSGDTKANNNRK